MCSVSAAVFINCIIYGNFFINMVSWREQPLQLVLDMNDRNFDENLLTWSTFRAIYDLKQQDLVPAGALSLLAEHITADSVKCANIPHFAQTLASLCMWKIWEDNYFDSSEDFRGRFLHYFKANYLIMLEYGTTLHLPLTA